MTTYEYCPLPDAHKGIRLLELLPDEANQDIRIRLSQATLEDSSMKANKRIPSLDPTHLASTLPPSWGVEETVSGRIAFSHIENDTISWIHPDPLLRTSHYQRSEDEVFTHPAIPEFEALSYTWGSADNPEPIYVEIEVTGNDAIPETRTLLVQPNLYTALKFLRLSSKPRKLWIDAVCINQNDIRERNIQVCRMTAIYTLAKRVVIWLGPGSRNSGLAMSTMSYLGSQITYCKSGRWFATPEAEHVEWYRSTVTLPYNPDVWQSILDLVNRPWFERLWITQEVHLANEHSVVCCGLDEVTWEIFRAALIGLAWKQKTELPELRRRLTHISALAGIWSGRPMQTLLKLGEDRKCSDPRDKVYGLLGLAPESLAGKIKPNYLAPVEDVYRDTVVALLEQTKRLYFASCGRSRTYPRLPTWVSDFSEQFESRFDDLGFASGFSCTDFSLEGRSKLKVCGLQCLLVSDVSPPLRVAPDDAIEDLGHAETLRSWARSNFGSNSYPTGQIFSDAMAATLVMGQTGDKFETALEPYSPLQEWSAHLHEFLFAPSTKRLSDLGDKTLFRRIFQGQQILFSTQEGFIGLAQSSLQPGDKLCVILGCMGMVILRPSTDSKDTGFEVIGECYVHGFMEMEALLGPLRYPWAIKYKTKKDGSWYPWFFNSVSGQMSEDDPRLGPLPEEWEKPAWERMPKDPTYFVRFKNKVTGEVMNSDPRLLPPALRARGINLEMLELV